MATFFLIIIYVIFIGLGIPDSLFGAAWPAIYTEFDTPVSWANFITLTISGGTIVSSLLSGKLIKRFGTGLVTAVSTAMTAAALLGFAYSKSFIFLWVSAIPLGLGAGAIDTGLNNYVALNYKASHMSFLHCFYGIGVTLSPFLMSLALSDGTNWHKGYKSVFWFQLAITAISFLSLPLWSKVGKEHTTEAETEHSVSSSTSLLKNPKIYMVCAVFFTSCGMEYICGNWGSTYLVNAKGLAVDTAATVITFYYIGMTVGRFLSGITAKKFTSRQILIGVQAVLVAAILLLVLPLPSFASAIALFLIGLGNGPVYPNMLHLTPVNFGKEQSQSAMAVQMAISYFGILSTPTVFGIAAQKTGVEIFPYFIMTLYIILLICITMLFKFKEKTNITTN